MSFSHRERRRERLGKESEDEDPGTDDEEHRAAPPLDPGCPGSEALQGFLSSPGDQESEPEGEDHQHRRGGGEGEGGGLQAPGGQGVSGQTGQDGAGSAEAGQQIAKPKQDVAPERALPALTGREPLEGFDPLLDPMERVGQELQLDEPEQQQQRTHRQA